MENALTTLIPEVLAPLSIGTKVRLPDGTSAVVTRSSLDEVDVVHPELTFGRGPWTFERWQVQPA